MSLLMPRVTSDAPESLPTPRIASNTPLLPHPSGTRLGLGVQWVQDVQMGWGDMVEEVMAEGTNWEQVLRVCLESRSLPSSLLVPADPGGKRR